MSFSQTSVTDVRAVLDGAEVYVSWASTAPWGTEFQVYVDRRLAWYGRSKSCHVPIPVDSASRNVWIEVGTVAPGEATLDFSASLSGPAGAGNRGRLAWLGGTYLDTSGKDDIRGFKIYRSPVPGAPVDFSTVIDTVAAYPGGVIMDGFGIGGFGQGGFGRSAMSYEWHSDPLASGNWTFAVAPFDNAGNVQSSPATVSATIASAPRPPAPDATGRRLTYSYSGPATKGATLSWLASP